MTVSELIEELKKYPPDMSVWISSGDEYGFNKVSKVNRDNIYGGPFNAIGEEVVTINHEFIE
jgi:hypothetical protein